MNVTDMRQKLRRSPSNQSKAGVEPERRSGSDRRVNKEGSAVPENFKRIWLTPGERNLIEDLYLLSGDDK